MRNQWNFTPVISTAPGFKIVGAAASTANALESTSIPRLWQGPGGRAVRLASIAADDYHIAFGTSTIVAASTDGILILGGTVETFKMHPSYSHMAVVSSTDVTVNVTLGYGN